MPNKPLLATLLFILPSFIFSQSNFTIDIYSGVDVSWRNLSSSDVSNNREIEERDTIEQSRVNPKIGLGLNKRLNQNLWIRFGVGFQNAGYVGRIVENPISIGGISTLDRIVTQYDYWLLNLPLSLRYEIPKNNWSLYIEGRLSPTILFKKGTRITEFPTREFTESSERFSRVLPTIMLLPGFNYKAPNHSEIFVQLNGRYSFRSIVDEPVEEFLKGLGLEIGFRKALHINTGNT